MRNSSISVNVKALHCKLCIYICIHITIDIMLNFSGDGYITCEQSLNACSHSPRQFNIVSIAMQMLMQRMGSQTPFSAFAFASPLMQWLTLMVTLILTQTQTSNVNKSLDVRKMSVRHLDVRMLNVRYCKRKRSVKRGGSNSNG